MSDLIDKSVLSTSDLSDEELAVRAVYDSKFFTFLVTRYKEKFFYYLKSFSGFQDDEAEDVIQVSFIKIYKNLNNFDRRLKFSSWAYRIVRNEAIDELRRSKRNQSTALDNLEIPDAISLTEEMDKKLAQEIVLKTLKDLKAEYREILVLRFFAHKEYKEISDILQKPIGTVCTLIDRAKKQFKDKYQNYAG